MKRNIVCTCSIDWNLQAARFQSQEESSLVSIKTLTARRISQFLTVAVEFYLFVRIALSEDYSQRFGTICETSSFWSSSLVGSSLSHAVTGNSCETKLAQICSRIGILCLFPWSRFWKK